MALQLMRRTTRQAIIAGSIGAIALSASVCVSVARVNNLSSADVPASLDRFRPAISYELSDTPANLTPRERFAWWALRNKTAILDAEHRWGIDRRAIAGVVMYESLENREPLVAMMFGRYAGPGKLHYKAERFAEGEPVTKEVEDLGYLPRRTVDSRMRYIETDRGSLEYIGAIMRAYNDIATRRGYRLSCDPRILSTLYTSWTIKEFTSHISRRSGRALEPNVAGEWVGTQLAFIRDLIGTPAKATCGYVAAAHRGAASV